MEVDAGLEVNVVVIYAPSGRPHAYYVLAWKGVIDVVKSREGADVKVRDLFGAFRHLFNVHSARPQSQDGQRSIYVEN